MPGPNGANLNNPAFPNNPYTLGSTISPSLVSMMNAGNFSGAFQNAASSPLAGNMGMSQLSNLLNPSMLQNSGVNWNPQNTSAYYSALSQNSGAINSNIMNSLAPTFNRAVGTGNGAGGADQFMGGTFGSSPTQIQAAVSAANGQAPNPWTADFTPTFRGAGMGGILGDIANAVPTVAIDAGQAALLGSLAAVPGAMGLGGLVGGGITGGALAGAAGGLLSGSVGTQMNGQPLTLGTLGKDALMGAVTGGIGGTGETKSAIGALEGVGAPSFLANGLVHGAIGSGVGAIQGALNGQGAAQGAAAGGIDGALSGAAGGAGLNSQLAGGLGGVGTGLLMNQLFSPSSSPTVHAGTTGAPITPQTTQSAQQATQPQQMMQAGGGLLNVAANHPYPLTSGLLNSLSNSQQPAAQTQSVGGQMPAGVTNYSQIAYQNAGSPHVGPYAQVAAPSGIGVPGEPPQGSGNSTIQTILGGLLGTAASNPSLLKSIGGSLGGLLNGYLNGNSASNTVGQPVFGGTSSMTDPFAGTNLGSSASAIGNYNSQPIDLSSLYGSPFNTSTPAVPTYTNYAGLSGMTMPTYNFGGP